MRRLSALFIIPLLFAVTHSTWADKALIKRPNVQHFIRYMVKQHHFNYNELSNTLAQVNIQPQIIESMNKPYEKKTWDVYQKIFLTEQRVNEGVAFWEQNQAILAKAEQQYGVPASMIVAIIGVETLYGKHQGNYRVIDALSTLAFNYPSRSDFFTKELAEYLILCREHKVHPTTYMGSYAGAIGKPQFMPSSYRHYAVDSNGKGQRDLVNDDNDVIASVANYFQQHGWRTQEDVAEPASVAGTRYKTINTSLKKAEYSVDHFARIGVKPAQVIAHAPSKAGLIELINDTKAEYWIAFPNFYVITRYNSSPQYALAVYLLSQQLQQEWQKKNHMTQR